jgi:hypothetical protein
VFCGPFGCGWNLGRLGRPEPEHQFLDASLTERALYLNDCASDSLLPYQIICAQNDHLLRGEPFIIARGYTYHWNDHALCAVLQLWLEIGVARVSETSYWETALVGVGGALVGHIFGVKDSFVPELIGVGVGSVVGLFVSNISVNLIYRPKSKEKLPAYIYLVWLCSLLPIF